MATLTVTLDRRSTHNRIFPKFHTGPNYVLGFKDSKGIFGTSPNYKKHRIKVILKKSTTKYYYSSACVWCFQIQIHLFNIYLHKKKTVERPPLYQRLY